jgi:hypothetical protein
MSITLTLLLTLSVIYAIKCHLVLGEGSMPRRRKDIVAVTLRIREELRRRLEQQAKKNRNSLNAEMEARLARSFEPMDTASLMRATIGAELSQVKEELKQVIIESTATAATAAKADLVVADRVESTGVVSLTSEDQAKKHKAKTEGDSND